MGCETRDRTKPKHKHNSTIYGIFIGEHYEDKATKILYQNFYEAICEMNREAERYIVICRRKMNERKQITIIRDGSTKRSFLKEHKIYIYWMPSHLKDFREKVKPIKEYDWTGTVIKKVVILNFPGVLFAFEKYIKFPER